RRGRPPGTPAGPATRAAGAARPARAAGPVLEGLREHVLQLVGLVAGELAVLNFLRDQIVDLRLHLAARGPRAGRLVRLALALQRLVDVVERARQRVLVVRADGAGRDFRLQLILQPLER